MYIDLTEKVAIVTGGNGGLGEGFVRALAAAGASVAINYVDDKASATALAEQICEAGGQAEAMYGDVSNPADADRLVADTVDRFAAVDILVNNAGVGYTADLVDTPPEQWDRVLDINLKGQYLCGRAAVRYMLERRSGTPHKIINIASEVGIMGLEGLTAYASSKAGVIGLTKSWAKELAPQGIHVNAIAPGPFDTPMLTDFERSPEYLATIPAGRLGTPEELGTIAAFLASRLGDFFVGQVLSPNGGVQI